MRKIAFAYILFLILLGIQSGEAQITEDLPKSHGCYILKNGELVELPEVMATKKSPLKGPGNSWGILGLDSKPEIAVEEQRPAIFLFEPGLSLDKLRLGRLWYFEKLRAVDFHGEPPGAESFRKSCGVEGKSLLDFGKWTIVGTYTIKTGKVPSRPEVFRIRPKKKLPPGVYAVFDGTKFTSRPVQGDSGIPLRAFEVAGAENKPAELTPVINPRVKILKCNICNKLEGIENLRGAKDSFFVSDDSIIIYTQVKGQRSGEVMEFIWYRPDGTVQARQKRALALAPSGKIFHVYQEFKPTDLLMPGRWILAIKIYGELVKCIPFHVIST